LGGVWDGPRRAQGPYLLSKNVLGWCFGQQPERTGGSLAPFHPCSWRPWAVKQCSRTLPLYPGVKGRENEEEGRPLPEKMGKHLKTVAVASCHPGNTHSPIKPPVE